MTSWFSKSSGFPGHVPGIVDGGGLGLLPESGGSFPVPGPEIDTGAIAAVPGAIAGVTAGLPGTGVQNTSNYSDSSVTAARSEPSVFVFPRSKICHASWPLPLAGTRLGL